MPPKKKTATEPDFNFPIDMLEHVEKQMASIDPSSSPMEGRNFLNALLAGVRAFGEIDPDNIEGQLEYVRSHTRNVRLNEADRALVIAMEAQLLKYYYDSHRWQIFNREVPGDSVTLWNERQFNDTIDALFERAGKMAGGAKVEDFMPKVITKGNLEVFGTFGSLFHAWSGSDKPFSQYCEKGSPAYFYWLNREITLRNGLDKYIAEYEENSEYEWSGLLLIKLFRNYCPVGVRNPNNASNKENEERERIVALAKKAVELHPDFRYNAFLLSSIKRVTAPSVSLQLKPYVPLNEKFSIDLNIYNAKTVKLEFCKIKDRSISTEKIAALPTEFTMNYPADSMYCNPTVDVVLKESGQYAVRVKIDGNKDFDVVYTEATPFIPILAFDGKEAVAITTDYTTGAPVKGVEVIGSGKEQKQLGRTSSDGILRFTNWTSHREYWGNIDFEYKGQSYNFDRDMRLYFRNRMNAGTTYKINILSDRAVYHPGESVSWVVVCGQQNPGGNKSPMEETPIRVVMTDASGKQVAQQDVVTDSFGRVDGTFEIPQSGLTGSFSLRAQYAESNGYCRIMVSDFKAPVLEAKIDSLDMSMDRVVIKGVATTLSGMPAVDAEACLQVKSVYSYDDVIYEYKTRTNASGRFEFVVEQDSIPEEYEDEVLLAEVTVTTPAAEVAWVMRSFQFDVQYNLKFEKIEDAYSTEKPLTFTVVAEDINDEFGALSYIWELKNAAKTVVKSGESITGETVSVDISDLPAGSYDLTATPEDEEKANEEISEDFILYNIEKNQVPDNSVIFLPDGLIKASSDAKSIKLTVGTPDERTYVYSVVVTEKGITDVRNYEIHKGFSKIEVPLSGTEDVNVYLLAQKNCKTSNSYVRVERVQPVKLRIEVDSFRDNITPGSKETWRMRISGPDAASAAAVATMYSHALDLLAPYRANLHFDFRNVGNYFTTSTVNNFSRSLYYTLPVKMSGREPDFTVPQFVYLGQRYIRNFNTVKIRGYASANSGSGTLVPGLDVASTESEETTEDSAEYELADRVVVAYGEQSGEASAEVRKASYTTGAIAIDADAGMAEPEVEIREPEVLQAFWMPRLLADEEGVVTIEFTVPNANTTWAFHMFGWTSKLLSAKFDATTLASKPVMVQSAVPRYLRQGDRATLRATVYNNTDSTASVNTVFEIFNPADSKVIDTVRQSVILEPKGSAVISAPVEATATEVSVGYRIKAYTSDFSDGEQGLIPVLASAQMLVESKEFYMDAKGEPVTLKVPDAKDAVTTFQYCQNPVWSIVKALRGVRWEDYSLSTSVATQLGSASLARHIVRTNPRIARVLEQWKANPDSEALTSMLEKNSEMKTLLLDQTPWVQVSQNETERMNALAYVLDSDRCQYIIDRSLDALAKFRCSDGGFRWALWSEEKSSEWITVNVLETWGIANSFGALPDELDAMVRDAFRWVEKKAVSDPKNKWLRLQFSFIATLFPAITPTEEGLKVLKESSAYLIANWDKMSLGDKAYAAMILKRNNHSDVALRIIRSIEQFGKMTPGRGIEFPSVKDMRSYGNIIQAVATVTPDNQLLDSMRQWVILQTQATDDLGACNPDYVIASVLLTGTVWSDMTSVQPISINGQDAMFPQAELGTGYLTASLEPGTTVTVASTGVTPSYGSIVSVFTSPMASVPAFKTSDLEISKRMMVERDGKWVDSKNFRFGEEVKIQLQIIAKRTLEYVAVTDERPAGFEPLEQLPGWIWSNGIGFYRENRDSSTRLFIGYLPKGSYSLTYSMTAATSGTFASGVATLQSQYDPALTAHSSGMIITIE